MASVVYRLTSSGSWTCPTFWDDDNNTIVCIGGGSASSPGGGGGYARKNNVDLTPGSSYSVVVGGAGGATYFNSTTVRANGGSGTSGGTGVYGDVLVTGSSAAGNTGGNSGYDTAVDLSNIYFSANSYATIGQGGYTTTTSVPDGKGGTTTVTDNYPPTYFGGGGGGGYGGTQGVIIIETNIDGSSIASSGPIYASDIRQVLYDQGQGTSVSMSNNFIRAITNKTTNVGYFDLRSKGSFYTFGYTDYYVAPQYQAYGLYSSGYGSGLNTPAFNPATWFPGIQSGDKFYVDVVTKGNWSNMTNRFILQYGTAISGYLSYNSTGYGADPGRKTIYYQAYYNGSNDFHIYHSYTGESTNFPNAETQLVRAQYLGTSSYAANTRVNLNVTYDNYLGSTSWYQNYHAQLI